MENKKQGAVVILRRSDGAICMQLRDDNPGIDQPNTWSLIGGAKDEGETVGQAAIRELKEETDYDADIEDLQEVLTAPQVTRRGHVIRHIFLLNYDEQQPIVCKEGQKIEFIEQDRLAEMKVFGDHLEFIREMEKMREGGGIENKG